MRRILSGVLIVGAGVLVGLSGWKTATSARHLANADEEVARAWSGSTVSAGTAGLGLRPAAAGAATVDLAAAGRALVFVFDVDCGPCGTNMWNWVDLVRDVPAGSVSLLAVAFREPERSERYWGGLEHKVHVALADTAEMRKRFGVTITPTTLLVRDGQVQRAYRGMLSPAAKREILAELRDE